MFEAADGRFSGTITTTNRNNSKSQILNQDFYKVLICTEAIARNLKKYEVVCESSNCNYMRSVHQAAY